MAVLPVEDEAVLARKEQGDAGIAFHVSKHDRFTP